MKKNILIKSLIGYVFIFLFLTGCSNGIILSELLGKEWSVTSIESKVLDASKLDEELPKITFHENGNLTGFTSCNTFNGSYKFEGDKIYLEPGSITKMMCFDSPEVEFLSALKKINGINLEGNNLELLSSEKIVMTLVPGEN